MIRKRDDEVAIAEAARFTNKKAAIKALKKRNRLEKQIDATYSVLENLEAQMTNTDEKDEH